MTTVYHYRYYCPTEDAYRLEWGTTAPTNCPVDSAVIDQSTVSVVQTVTTEEVIVTDGADGWYQSTAISMDVPGATGTYTEDTSWPCDIILWTAVIYLDANSTGDSFQIIVAPNTAIGYLTAGCTSSSTTITVSPTVIAFVQRGLELTLNDGVNENQLGRITAIDTNTNTITFETATTNTFSAFTPVYISIYVIRNFITPSSMVGATKLISFAGKGLRGKIIPANTLVRYTYTNNSAVAKNVSIKLEYFMTG